MEEVIENMSSVPYAFEERDALVEHNFIDKYREIEEEQDGYLKYCSGSEPKISVVERKLPSLHRASQSTLMREEEILRIEGMFFDKLNRPMQD